MQSILTLIIVGSMIASAPAPAVSMELYEPDWLDDLSLQLLVQNDCTVEYFVSAKQAIVEDEIVFSARARCVDGRKFNATRRAKQWVFTVERCCSETC